MSHDHDHHHGEEEMSHLHEMDARVKALESLLVEKGYVDSAAIDELGATPHHRQTFLGLQYDLF